MKLKIILHAGLHKTGTTSIQFNCKKYSNELLAHDIYYVKFSKDGWENHSVPLCVLFQDTPRLQNHTVATMFKSDEAVASAKLQMSNYFSSELSGNNSGTLLLSAEDLSGFSVENLEKVKKYFLEINDCDFEVVIYVRNPVSFALSDAQELVRAGLKTIESAFEVGNLQNAELKIKKFVNVFGINNIHVFSFDDAVEKYSDVSKHFFNFIGCSNVDMVKRVTNSSSSVEKILTLVGCNSFGADVIRKIYFVLSDDGSKFVPENSLKNYIKLASKNDEIYLKRKFNISFKDIKLIDDQTLNYLMLHKHILYVCEFLLSLKISVTPLEIYIKIIRDTIIYLPKLSSLICVRAFNIYKSEAARNFLYHFKSIDIIDGDFFDDIFLLTKDKFLLDSFNAKEYLLKYSDVAVAGFDPFKHYYIFGQFEGRNGFFNE